MGNKETNQRKKLVYILFEMDNEQGGASPKQESEPLVYVYVLCCTRNFLSEGTKCFYKSTHYTTVSLQIVL